ncbi:hypothetical protein L226DRAFT_265046 [Lentinus tigrinus ALCF2SS1-7]|nr:hypothetical protein L226DRAFT_265046 [Lentinus tigrinus ALCF2SS1-7]
MQFVLSASALLSRHTALIGRPHPQFLTEQYDMSINSRERKNHTQARARGRPPAGACVPLSLRSSPLLRLRVHRPSLLHSITSTIHTLPFRHLQMPDTTVTSRGPDRRSRRTRARRRGGGARTIIRCRFSSPRRQDRWHYWHQLTMTIVPSVGTWTLPRWREVGTAISI